MTRDIFIACDSFLALRNVRNAELGTRLSEMGYRVRVFVDPHQIEGSIEAKVPGIEIEPSLDFNPNSYRELQRWLYWMNLGRRSFKDPTTHYSKLEYRLASRRLMKYFPFLYFTLGWIIGALGLFRIFRKLSLKALRQTSEYERYRSLLAKEHPAVVAGFSPEGYREMVLLQAAADSGIPTMIMIRSRDNLTSKIVFLPEVDEYLVWSEHQKEYFYRLYPELNNHPVNVVGSPQFCRHKDESFRLKREEFFEKVKLDTSRPMVVFCLENPAVAPHQGNMAVALAEAFEKGRINHGAQLLIRNHPRAFGSDYDPLGGRKFDSVSVYPLPTPVPLGKHDSNLVQLILNDELMHLATMTYQDVNVNIMSTVIIDSAILNKPVVNVAFDIPENTPRSITVKRFFKRTDFKIIEEIGATDKANSMDELIEMINFYLDNPQHKSKERLSLVEKDIGVIGQASNEKILTQFLKLANNPTE